MFGAGWMLHRRWEATAGWVICNSTDQGHEPDSGVHRFDRVHGYAIGQDEAELVQRNAAAAEAERASRRRNKQSSHQQIVQRFSFFERYMLEFHPEEPYTVWLRSIRAAALDPYLTERVAFKAPPPLLLLAYVRYLRKKDPAQEKPDRKYNTILAYINSISSVLREFGYKGRPLVPTAHRPCTPPLPPCPSATTRRLSLPTLPTTHLPPPTAHCPPSTAYAHRLPPAAPPVDVFPTHDKRILDQLEEYEEFDVEGGAPGFDVETTVPKMWAQLWLLVGWSKKKRLCAWAMFLTAMCVCARASCITTFCPRMEDMRLPKPSHWDADGIPKYIIFIWRRRPLLPPPPLC